MIQSDPTVEPIVLYMGDFDPEPLELCGFRIDTTPTTIINVQFACPHCGATLQIETPAPRRYDTLMELLKAVQ